MMHLQGVNVQAALAMGNGLPRTPREEMSNPLWNHYRCGDGKWICLGMLESHRYWADFCSAMGIAHLQDDPRFKDPTARGRNSEELITILDVLFASRPRGEWMKILHQGGDFIFTIVNDVSDLAEDQQALINNYIVDYHHSVHGAIKVAGFPVHFGESPCSIQRQAPELGEHSSEILTRYGGYSPEEIDVMLKDKVVISSAPRE